MTRSSVGALVPRVAQGSSAAHACLPLGLADISWSRSALGLVRCSGIRDACSGIAKPLCMLCACPPVHRVYATGCIECLCICPRACAACSHADTHAGVHVCAQDGAAEAEEAARARMDTSVSEPPLRGATFAFGLDGEPLGMEGAAACKRVHPCNSKDTLALACTQAVCTQVHKQALQAQVRTCTHV